MAYKFQLGDAIMSGNLEQEGEIAAEELDIASTAFIVSSAGALTTTQEASLDGGVDVNGNCTISAAGAIAGATNIDASGDLTVGTITMAEFTVAANGNTDIDGTLNVEGVPTFQAGAVFSNGITTANAIAGASTIVASGLANLDGGIEIDNGGNKFTVSTAGAVVAESSVSGAAGTFDELAGTSLALQGGAITAAGAITSDGKVTANEFDADEWSVNTAGAVVGVSATYSSNVVSSGGSVSGSSGLAGLGLTIAAKSNIGVIGDTDLMALASQLVTVSGALDAQTRVTTAGVTASSGVQFQGAMEVGGDIFLPGAGDTAFVVGSDSIYFLDSDGAVKRDSWADIMTLAAGVGITATNGVLSADSAATPNAIGDLSVNLTEGFNYATASLSAARTFTLPSSPTAGDTVHIKMMGGLSTSNYAAITGSAASSGDHFLIDGRSEAVRLESVSGAVSFVWTGANAVGWAIY